MGFEYWALLASIFLYAFCAVLSFIVTTPRPLYFTLCLAALLHLLSASIRWASIGHPPVFGTYEAALAASWFLVLFVIISYWSVHRHFNLLVKTAVPASILILLYGLTFNTEHIPLTISEKSLWVDFHALFSWLAFAPFTLAFCLSTYYLWKGGGGNAEQDGIESSEAASYPAFEIIDELAFRYINFGFIMHTIMFALGCYYSSILYGKWWMWDPAESTSLITWLSVGLYIHMRLFYNWRQRRAAWLFIAIFATVIFSYWGLIYLPAGSSFHVFDLELKAH